MRLVVACLCSVLLVFVVAVVVVRCVSCFRCVCFVYLFVVVRFVASCCCDVNDQYRSVMCVCGCSSLLVLLVVVAVFVCWCR